MTSRAEDAIEPPSAWLLLVAAVVVAVVVAGAGVFAFRASSPAQAAEPVAAANAGDQTDREALVAAIDDDPTNLAARLQLAHDYFDASEYDLALEQYLAVLRERPGHARSLARSGWIAFEGGDSRTAERLVGESLEASPDDAEALWFLGHIRLYGLREPQGATGPLTTLLARDDLSDTFRIQVEVLLERAREGARKKN